MSWRIPARPILLSLAPLLAACSNDPHLERMSREHEGDHPAPSPAAETAPAPPIETSTVVYATLDGTAVEGYLARPAGGGTAPGVLVIQEWWGLNDNIRAMADRLAGEGHLALAVDLYEGQVAQDRDTASSLMQNAMADPARLEENLRQARRFLADAGATTIGSIGWCFGGGWSLRAGLLLGDEIDAVVMFYGRVLTEEDELEPLRAPLLGHFGSEDRGIPIEGVRQFESALSALGKTATVHIYEGADHAFANPSGTRYDEEAAGDAWSKTLAFFAAHLGG